MKLFNFRGGIHPETNKKFTAKKNISIMPMPKCLYIPLQQHIGAPAEPTVEIGQHVYKGQLLAHSQGNISAPVHAPTSGTVIAIGPFAAPHPSGLMVRTITLQADGEDKWEIREIPPDPFTLSTEEISARVEAAGIVGLGGATFPTAPKLRRGLTRKVHTLIINGGECEPYLTCDDRLMQERPKEVVDGVHLILHAIRAERAFIAVEKNKPKAIKALHKVCAHLADIQVIPVPSRYPMGSDKQLIQTLIGKEVPGGGSATDLGLLVHNVGTAYAVHRAVRKGQPLISRIVTVGGDAIQHPQNVEVPIGTLLAEVINFCGGFSKPVARILMGGPMMGQMMTNSQVPVIKGTSGIIALSAQKVAPRQTMPCIRCGSCVQACPCGLMPLEMAAHIRHDNLDKAMNFGLTDCVACGCCAYVCPAHIPLVQYFNYAKGALVAREQTKHKAEQTRKLVDLRKQRHEKEAQARALAAAKRKAEKEAAAKTGAKAKTIDDDDDDDDD
jgi:electron transport complex protein RnfC